MNWYSIFYWLMVADGVKKGFDIFSNIFTWFAVLSFVVYVIICGYGLTTECDDKDVNRQWRTLMGRFFYWMLSLCIVTWFGYIMTPTKKDCMLIVAGGAVGNFLVTDSSAKQLPSDITTFLHLSLKKEVDDLGSDFKKELNLQSNKEKLIDKAKEMSKEELIKFLEKDSTLVK